MRPIARAAFFASILATSLSPLASVLAEEFPAGTDGELYYTVRIDLLPGDPQTVELDGFLDDPVWECAAWHRWSGESDRRRGDALPPDFTPISADKDFFAEWAAVSDGEFLYVAWRVTDDVKQNFENGGCDVWQDDSVELYIDAKNDGPNCPQSTSNCYREDDAQFAIGLNNLDNLDPENPDELVVGGLAGHSSCDFNGQPAPDLIRGVVREVLDEELETYRGWTAEVAIALTTEGNLPDPLAKEPDGTPTWEISPEHGSVIGWNVQPQDDDIGGGRDHKLIWSSRETVESAWRNPGVFGKMMFIDPTQEEIPTLIFPVDRVICRRNPAGTVTVGWFGGEGHDPAEEIRIFVDGVLTTTVPGTENRVILTEEQVPQNGRDHIIGVMNGSNVAIECLLAESAFDECGGIRLWNLLGAYTGTNHAPGLEAMREDFMTDGVATEKTFNWHPGASIQTDFDGAAVSTGITPDVEPTVQALSAASSRIDLDSFFSGPDNVMAYAQCYVINEGEPIEVFCDVWSDDSIYVTVNDEEVGFANEGRGVTGFCNTPQNTFGPFMLESGENRILLKCFDGSFGWEFAFRFSIDGEPFTEDLGVQLASDSPNLPVLDLTCQRQADFSVVLEWRNPDSTDPDVETRILVEGEEVATVPGDATTATLEDGVIPRDGGVYEVEVINNSELPSRCVVLGSPVEISQFEEIGGQLLINCGALVAIEDKVGRVWEPDLIYLAFDQAPSNVAIGNPFAPDIDLDALEDPDIPQSVIRTERWCDCDLHYSLLAPEGQYEVSVFFAETCADCVSGSLGGNNIEGANRVFDVRVEEQVVEAYSPADAAEGDPNDGFGAIDVATQLDFRVHATDGAIDITIEDLGRGNPPENAAVKAIKVTRVEGDSPPRFKRGDVDGVGGIIITDGIYLLNFLFLGRDAPPCEDAADANDRGKIDISTAIYLFNFLFLGGDNPPAPGFEFCGEDPTPDELGCEEYDNCE